MIKSRNLQGLFEYLSKNGSKLYVLRGYYNLPYMYSNDIDIFVDKSNLNNFYNLLIQYHGCTTTYEIKVIRYGLEKINLHLGDEIHNVDILYDFSYVGLNYVDASLLNHERFENFYYFYPPYNIQLRIEFLKELLHNARIREDKFDHLNTLYSNYGIYNSDALFDPDDINYLKSIFQSKRLHLLSFRRIILKKLISLNLKNFGFYGLMHNLFRFIRFKYFSF